MRPARDVSAELFGIADHTGKGTPGKDQLHMCAA